MAKRATEEMEELRKRIIKTKRYVNFDIDINEDTRGWDVDIDLIWKLGSEGRPIWGFKGEDNYMTGTEEEVLEKLYKQLPKSESRDIKIGKIVN